MYTPSMLPAIVASHQLQDTQVDASTKPLGNSRPISSWFARTPNTNSDPTFVNAKN